MLAASTVSALAGAAIDNAAITAARTPKERTRNPEIRCLTVERKITTD
jgi:hypothetical protein